MTFLNVSRVTVDPANDADDLFSFEPCVELQRQGRQIVQTRCGHLMDEQGLARWAQQVLSRPDHQDRVVRCPLCRENLMDRNFESIEIGAVLENPEQDEDQGGRQAGAQGARQHRANDTLRGILFFGGAFVFTAGFLGYLIGRGYLAHINPDDPITLNQLNDAILGIGFTLVGQAGMAVGGLATVVGGVQIAANAAVNYAAEKTHQAARGLYNWFIGQ